MKLSGKFSVTFDSCDKEQYMVLGDKLKDLRSSRGVSQQQLGEIINRCRTGLSAYERGVKVPTLNGLYEIAEALNYKFNINFEDRSLELENDIDKIVVLDESYANRFMERMKQHGTLEFEYLCRMKAENEKWDIGLVQKDRINLVSDSGKEIRISTRFYNQELKSNRFAYINVYFKVGCTEKNPAGGYFVDYYLDMAGEYSLEDMILLELNLKEFIAVEEVIYACGRHKRLCDCFDMDKVYESSFKLNRKLKIEYGLSDDEIVNLIELMFSEFKNPNCFSVLNRSREVDENNSRVFEIALCLVSEYINSKYVNLEVVKKSNQIADYLKAYESLLLLVSDNICGSSVEYSIRNKAVKDSLSYVEVNNKIDGLIVDCIESLEEMEDRNEDKSIEDTILSLIYVFNPDVNMDFLEDHVINCMEIR